MLNKKILKNLSIIIGIIVFVLVAYSIIIMITRIGETKVVIAVSPSNSTVFIDGKEVSSKTIYLGAGNYEFTARFDNFEDDNQKIKVGNSEKKVILLPKASSGLAVAYLENNPQIQQEREGLGGELNNIKGNELFEKNPIIEKLPVTEVSRFFSIDYSLTPDENGGLKIIISSIAPEGRKNAIEWLKEQGFDFEKSEIIFKDFVNPLNSVVSNEES